MNEIRPFVVKVKEFYDKGLYTLAQIDNMLVKGKITQDEYNYIIGLVTE